MSILTSILDVLQKAPTGCTWSYRMMTPTITLMQNMSVSSLVNLLLYSLKEKTQPWHHFLIQTPAF